ncbi:MAG TPA: isoprenylcysteine carboxylmethyltransferase family protein [Rhodoblastus sp.]|nr:isoprenylcysteine carboxylmethyltransferase family protein [Rhodoblastus sp.]
MRLTPGMMLLSLVSTLAYLGLAVWAEGGPAAWFGKPPLVALFAYTLVLAAAALFTEGNVSPGEKEDRGNRWVLAAFGVLGFAGAFVPALDDRYGWLTFGGDGLRWLGVALFVGGGALRMAPVFILGKRFSGLVAIQPGHRLVTTGLYGAIRHPSYLGLLVMSFGWALAFRSGLGLILAALNLVPLVARIRAEEAFLAAHFGAEYEAWRARTARLAPGMW